MNQPRIIFIDDESCYLEGLEITINSLFGESRAFDVEFFDRPEKALESIKRNPFNVCLVFMDHDFLEPAGKKTVGSSFIQPIKRINSHIEVIMMSGDQTTESLQLWLKNGADKFFYKQFVDHGAKLKIFISEALTRFRAKFGQLLENENNSFLKIPEELKKVGLVSVSSEMKAIADFILQSANSDLSVLIFGETGTGKELVARAIHENSDRKDKEFRTIDCTQFKKSELIASELFGSEKGAFTGAESKVGLLEIAHGGTVFLDEVHHLGEQAQAMLLRFLEDKKVRRVGGKIEKQVNVRFVFAAKPILKQYVNEDKFLADLIYRMKEIKIELPTLSERMEDVEVLSSYFLDKYSKSAEITLKKLHPDTLDILKSHSWPGNIRELEKVIKILASLVKDPIILPEHLEKYAELEITDCEGRKVSIETLDQMNIRHENEARALILKAYQSSDYNLSETARKLGIARTSLRSQCVSLGIWESMDVSSKRDLAENKGEFRKVLRNSVSSVARIIESTI